MKPNILNVSAVHKRSTYLFID